MVIIKQQNCQVGKLIGLCCSIMQQCQFKQFSSTP